MKEGKRGTVKKREEGLAGRLVRGSYVGGKEGSRVQRGGRFSGKQSIKKNEKLCCLNYE